MTAERPPDSTGDVSVIVRLSRLCQDHGAIDLARGMLLEPIAPELTHAAMAAVEADASQYTANEGLPALRAALARQFAETHGVAVDPETEVTVCCGSTEALACVLLSALEPGDEVIVFEPFYESYLPIVALARAVPRFVSLRPPAWSIDEAELAAAGSPRTRAIVVNTPHNPTGKVFTRAEVEGIGALCRRWNALAICDEVYEHFVYDGRRPLSPCASPALRGRAVHIGSGSKTLGVTGWRIGYAIAPAAISRGIRRLHGFLTVCAPAPFQRALAAHLPRGRGFSAALAATGQQRRDALAAGLRRVGFEVALPGGGWYLLAGYARLSDLPDAAFAEHLIASCGVGAVPGSYFYRAETGSASRLLRFCFYRRPEDIAEACERLRRLPQPFSSAV